ncbi:MAG: DEAD/DEAH box helicase family protein [Desulfuromonadaceae bacterium]|nr:DEAD/DEAH box helicase family protein [Desulfuromonadaceae bacterium]
MKHNRATLIEAIALKETQLARLDAERQVLLDTLHDLRQQVSAIDASSSPASELSSLSSDDKITLFRSLFKGREDVYPKLWVSKNGDRKGYMPACANDGVYTLCGKRKTPRVRCSDCKHQSYVPVTDEVLKEHLQGKQTIGVYPLLPDDTCRFLAVDFDKTTWQEDVAAFRETCTTFDLPVAIERSRSGNGAHAWFFFSEPVMAATARVMGCYLITETMSRRHQLSMESYDRLFPSQDTMPRGGFGNLIALPLQWEPRKKGNSVFVDETFSPYLDQWGYLTSLKRLSSQELQSIADKAVRKGQVIGLRLPSDHDEEQAPWERSPSGRLPEQRIKGKLPKTITAVLAQKIFVEKKSIPSEFLNRIKRLAAFQNPEFYKKQKMRLSTHNTPRVIACFEELPEYVALPRGCRDALETLLNELGITLHLDDKRQAGVVTSFEFHGTLSDVQQQAVDKLMQHDIGIFVAPPGSGKTVVGAWMTAARNCSTLILVHRKPLLDQWVAQLARFLDLPPKSIGTIGSGKSKATGVLDVAMMQSLVRKDEVADLVATYGQIIVDECHHLPAFSFERVLAEVKARYVVGLTATPYRRDGHQPIIHMQCGPTRYSLDRKQQESRDAFTRRLILRETSFTVSDSDKETTIQEIYALLASDRERNRFILDDIRKALADGRSPILLTERKDHLELFAGELRDSVKHLVVLHGGMGVKQRRKIIEHLAAIPDDEERLILATGRYIGEGFDDARLDTLFLALPFSWKGMLVQYAGRLHRLRAGKKEVRVYDYVDGSVPMLAKMHEKRMKGFRTLGYEQVT